MPIAESDTLARGLYRVRLAKPWKAWDAGMCVDVYPNVAERLILDGYANLVRRGCDQPKFVQADEADTDEAKPRRTAKKG